MALLAGRLPHGKFRGQERIFDPPIELGAGRKGTIEFAVRCRERPGGVVENAFLILDVLWRERAWQMFIRFRVAIDERGRPLSATELVTAQETGFSTAI